MQDMSKVQQETKQAIQEAQPIPCNDHTVSNILRRIIEKHQTGTALNDEDKKLFNSFRYSPQYPFPKDWFKTSKEFLSSDFVKHWLSCDGFVECPHRNPEHTCLTFKFFFSKKPSKEVLCGICLAKIRFGKEMLARTSSKPRKDVKQINSSEDDKRILVVDEKDVKKRKTSEDDKRRLVVDELKFLVQHFVEVLISCEEIIKQEDLEILVDYSQSNKRFDKNNKLPADVLRDIALTLMISIPKELKDLGMIFDVKSLDLLKEYCSSIKMIRNMQSIKNKYKVKPLENMVSHLIKFYEELLEMYRKIIERVIEENVEHYKEKVFKIEGRINELKELIKTKIGKNIDGTVGNGGTNQHAPVNILSNITTSYGDRDMLAIDTDTDGYGFGAGYNIDDPIDNFGDFQQIKKQKTSDNSIGSENDPSGSNGNNDFGSEVPGALEFALNDLFGSNGNDPFGSNGNNPFGYDPSGSIGNNDFGSEVFAFNGNDDSEFDVSIDQILANRGLFDK